MSSRDQTTSQETIFGAAISQGTVQPLIIRQLGTRLEHLYDWVIAAATQLNSAHVPASIFSEPYYTDIWDLCCDHGRLGMHLSQTSMLGNSHIHLVDCVPSILEALHKRYPNAPNDRLSFILADAAHIEFMHRGPQAIILAGVGGGTVMKILNTLLARGLPQENLGSHSHTSKSASFTDFFISANSDAFELRRYLNANDFVLIKEELVSEKGFHHEHLQLRHGTFDREKTATIEQSEVGNSLWLTLDNHKKNYLKKLLKHHQLSYQFKHLALDLEAANAYQKILARDSTCAYSQ